MTVMTRLIEAIFGNKMAQAFFDTEPEPEHHAELVASVASFLDHHASTARVVLVTSGGTLVPLERRTVRFLDNFSGGRRGAASVEAFLEQGYCVVFFHRKFSLRPYERQLGDSALDLLMVREDGSIGAHGKLTYASKSRSEYVMHGGVC